MNNLTDLFNEQKETIRQHLQNANSLSEVVQILRSLLDSFCDKNGPYLASLSAQQIHLSQTLLGQLRSGLDILTFLIHPSQNSNSQHQERRDLIKTLLENQENIGSAVGGAAVGSFVGGIPGLAIGTAAGIVVGYALEHSDMLSSISRHVYVNDAKREMNVVEINTTINTLTNALAKIDHQVSKCKEVDPSPQTGFERYPQLLELFQNLLGETQNSSQPLPQFLEDRLSELSSLLRRDGIQICYYPKDSAERETANSYFEMEPSLIPGVSDYKNLVPAFIKNGKVLLPGRVIKPDEKQ